MANHQAPDFEKNVSRALNDAQLRKNFKYAMGNFVVRRKTIFPDAVENEKLRTKLGDNGRRRFEESFTTEIFARNFESYLRNWIHESGRAQGPTVSDDSPSQAKEAEPSETSAYKTA